MTTKALVVGPLKKTPFAALRYEIFRQVSAFLQRDSYCLSEKSWPILYSNLQYKMWQDFLGIKQYHIFSDTYLRTVSWNQEKKQQRTSEL